MYVPRNLQDGALSTQSPLMCRGAWAGLCRLKSMMISLVLDVFSWRLRAEPHADSCWTSSLYAVSSPPEMSPTTVVSSANFIMRLEGWEGEQSDVYRVYRSGLNTQPWGEPVLSVRGEERWGPSLTCCGLLERKSFIQAQVEAGRCRPSSLFIRMSGIIVLKAEL